MEETPLWRQLMIIRLVEKGEEALLCLLLTILIVVACIQICLRTFFDSGLLWVDPLLPYLVLWCGFLGAVTATGQRKHIALDLVSRYLTDSLRSQIDIVITLFCTLAAGGLCWAGFRFLRDEYLYGGSGPLGLPLWAWNSIFFLAFLLIAAKYLLIFSCQIYTAWIRRPRRTSRVP